MTVERSLESINLPTETTRRPISEGAEKWLGEPIPVLDHGFVYLVDYMGNDEAVEQAARVSYGRGTRKVSQTRGLIRYLRRHRHTTPFEMVEFKFHAKLPIFVARQWVRHRTANINEYSARYSVLNSEFYIPDQESVAIQSTTGRQGRGETVSDQTAEEVRTKLADYDEEGYSLYKWLLNEDDEGKIINTSRLGIARELARVPLPINIYTEWYWKIDLHNLFHFLNLRMDEHAQWEIRQYANAMANIIEDAAPIAWEAFKDYELEATNLSRPEKEIMVALLINKGIKFNPDDVLSVADDAGLTNKREREELLVKFDAIGLISEEQK